MVFQAGSSMNIDYAQREFSTPLRCKEAICIASVTKDGKFLLNMNNVNLLLNILADKKDVAIISMAGAFRTGKSFMLNIFLQYLRGEGAHSSVTSQWGSVIETVREELVSPAWQNENWFGPEDKKLQDGFHWERGMMGLTKGINVWPEIFDVPLENGKGISVMIVDTQGLHDEQCTEDTDHKIMMLSTLLSSHQILNCSNKIEQRDLEFLHTSVEYAKAIAQKKGEHPFQAITFLVRDWNYNHEFEFGEKGGYEFADRSLKKLPANLPEPVKEVKQSIAITFENVYGFLMPLPKKEVQIRGKFRKYACQLTEKILHPKNLIAKKMCGKLMSTNSFLGLVVETSKLFESGNLPPVEKMIKCYGKADNIAVLIQAVSMYT
ncbi:atlastin-3-like [Styela clava]